MIENLMKAVKSSRKKKGINITIGAIVGFLLSCTAVMGADEYLWIKNDGSGIKFNTIITATTDGADGKWETGNPYKENGWIGNTYTNNITLSSSTANGKYNIIKIGYGLRLSGNLGNFNFINNGVVSGTGSGYGYGIYISDSSGIAIKNEGVINGTGTNSGNGDGSGISISASSEVTIENEGVIRGSGTGSGYYDYSSGSGSGYGISISNSSEVAIKNEGVINGTVNGTGISRGNGYGISVSGSTEVTIENEGVIRGSGTGSSDGYGSGIDISGTTGSSEVTIKNEGVIIGTGDVYGYGINISELTSTVENITNTGVIYGSTNAIMNYGATFKNAFNYGILANGGSSSTVDGLKVVTGSTTNQNEISNYGLIIKNGTIDGLVETSPKPFQIEFGNGTKSMTIENKKVTDGSDSFSGNKRDYILNALTNTYKATGTDDKVEESIINAYGTAVIFEGANNQLTLSGTIVSGGIDGSDTVSGSGNTDTLILQNGSIVNGNINMADGDDIVTVGNGTLINGTLDGGTGNDTLNFDSLAARTSNSDGIKIQHNISGFENMNINTNVTLFEKTVKDNGTLGDLAITGAGNMTIGANGVLTLRIDTSKLGVSGKIVGHALYGNTGTIASTGGKLLLALNGAGESQIISFGGTQLGSSLVTDYEGLSQEEVTFGTTSILHSVKRVAGNNNEVEVTALNNLPLYSSTYGYEKLNEIYQGIRSANELGNFNVDDDKKLSTFLGYLNDIYGGNPYSYSSELSRKSAGMFRDIVTENSFKADTGKWMIYGGLTHVDGGTKDTYYGKGYYTYDIGSSDIDADTKITGAYMLGEYGVSDTLTSGVVIGGNKLKSDLSNGSKVDGSALYLGAYAKKYIGNLKVIAGAGFQYGDYDADRLAVNKVASDRAESVMKYSDNYNDITYDIYLNGRYFNPIGDNLFLEPYATLSYTYIDQDGANEGSKTLAIETDSKSFDYTVGKVGVDLKKVIPHEKGKSTLSAGVSYTKIIDGADEEHITGRFKGEFVSKHLFVNKKIEKLIFQDI